MPLKSLPVPKVQDLQISKNLWCTDFWYFDGFTTFDLIFEHSQVRKFSTTWFFPPFYMETTVQDAAWFLDNPKPPINLKGIPRRKKADRWSGWKSQHNFIKRAYQAGSAKVVIKLATAPTIYLALKQSADNTTLPKWSRWENISPRLRATPEMKNPIYSVCLQTTRQDNFQPTPFSLQ